MTGDCRGDMVDPFSDRQQGIMRGKVIRKVRKQPLAIDSAQQCRRRAHEHRRRTKAFDVEPEVRQFGGSCFQPVACRFIQFDDVGKQQPLRGYTAADRTAPKPFKDEALVRRMLIYQDKPVMRLCDNIGCRHLSTRNAERRSRGNGAFSGFGTGSKGGYC